ncbi:MAG: divergent polysaccharide deacetylase family protein [Candidatus Omnitrophica bacterium]|nr:divergent polysaccharide deacetylase family protein [Candidatus Omnitrophota bacterium]
MRRRLWIILVVALALGATFYFIVSYQSSRLVKIAIVIDDWGYNMENIELLKSIDIPITVSILPSLAYSRDVAEILDKDKNIEVILHIPMEPEAGDLSLEKNTLMTSMSDERIASLLQKALESVPGAKGISNHMGSKATKHERLVKTLMRELRQKRLYFLDSMATLDTVCAKEAEYAGVRFAERDVFLDNNADRDYISAQIDELIGLARLKGSAIGIGHDKRLTLKVIKEKIENLEGTDIRFVFVSALSRRRR